MEPHNMQLQLTPDANAEGRRALAELGLWVRAGYVGAGLMTIEVMRLFTGEEKPALALTLAIVGALLAAFSWRRGRSLVERGGPTSEAVTVPHADGTAAPRNDVVELGGRLRRRTVLAGE